jgi:hypothetical protein
VLLEDGPLLMLLSLVDVDTVVDVACTLASAIKAQLGL